MKASSDIHRAWLTQQLAFVLKFGTFGLLLLLFAGFAHDLMGGLFIDSETPLSTALRRAGGWGGVLLAIGSAVYTAVKTAPSSAGAAVKPPGTTGKILMAIAPPLALVLLACGLAVLSRMVVRRTMLLETHVDVLAAAVVSLALLEILFAIFESYHDPISPPEEGTFSWRRFVPDPILRLIGQERTRYAGEPRPWYFMFSPRAWARIAAGLALVAVWNVADAPSWGGFLTAMTTVPRTCVATAILAAVFALSWWRRRSKIALGSARPVVLLSLASGSAALTLLSDGGIAHSAQDSALFAALLWIGLLVGAVVAIGSLAAPNLLSLHGFYRGRLTRAYLGASNTARDNEAITDAAPGDALKLTALWNHSEGAPYHLVNATLSLVGASDLASSQRSADNFIMSRYHCGSARAGYRCTAEYMSGQLPLGTVTAISGTAVSPTMGSLTPSAALTLLLSLINMRLGFWAPTPSGRRRNEPHARLWPFYLLRETLANTGTLGLTAI